MTERQRIWEPWEVPSPALEDARRLLADAEQAERQEQCAAQGHDELREITRFDSAQLEYLCASCGATIREDR